MAEVSGRIQSRMSRICNSTTVFTRSSYLHYHSAYGHQTWQGGNLPSGDLTYEVT